MSEGSGMSDRFLLATFDHENDLLTAVRTVQSAGYCVADVYTPYPVHGLAEALHWRPTRLTWVCFWCGLLGATGMFWFQQWTAAIDWPLNVGGKPWNSWPSDVPVTFEAMVFLACFGTVLAFLVVCRLFPGKSVRPIANGVTDDRFVLVLAETDAAFDVEEVHRLLQPCHVLKTEERLLLSPPNS